jgi:hypothetical protein
MTATNLRDLHGLLADELANRIRSGEAAPSDLNVARQFLKDNGIESLPVDDSPLKRLLETLPDPNQVQEFPTQDIPHPATKYTNN